MKLKLTTILVVIASITVSSFCTSCNQLTTDKSNESSGSYTATITDSETESKTEILESTGGYASESSNEPSSVTNTIVDTQKPSDPIELAIKEASDELEKKGWQNIEVFEGEPPYNGTSRWGYLIIAPYDLDDDSILYSIVGQFDEISAIVRVVGNSKTSEAQRVEHFYTATSGRELKGIYLESFLTEASKPDEILSAKDKEMYLYLCTGY